MAPVILSMTTIPARNGTLEPTVVSLYGQTVQPDEIRLYMGSECDEVEGVRCITTEDRGPVTKISAVLDDSLPNEAIVVTVDDDQIYHPRWLETLLEGVQKNPHCAVGFAGWDVTDKFLRKGVFERANPGRSCDVLEGFAGVAYRRNFFEADILDPPPEFRYVDDVWISSYLYRRNTLRRVIGPRMSTDRARRPGLHHRRDFVAMNQRASELGFGKPVSLGRISSPAVVRAPAVAQGSAPAKILSRMKIAAELLPWKTKNLALHPFKGFYAFNPSIHFDGETWRCVLRNSDYYAPQGAIHPKQQNKVNRTRNVMAILDPRTWEISAWREMLECDGHPRVEALSMGFEDIRLFSTQRDGLVGIATTMQLRSRPKPEMVLLRLGSDYAIIGAEPIRGAWSEMPQKNWAPYEGTIEPKFLYSIERGIVFDRRGPLRSPTVPQPPAMDSAIPEAIPAERTTTTGIMYGNAFQKRRMGRPPVFAAGMSRPVPEDWSSPGLRGGTQLISVGIDQWLGLAHEMEWTNERKNYWHTWILVDGQGRLLERSQPMKLSASGIEFAAGIASDDGKRLIVSFGTEDSLCWLGFTQLEAAMGILKPTRKEEG